ncbi:nucleotidyltransferase domain-containing protein [Haemophilus paraphrohaemolyticus]|uniref:nucleotidyltransferase domain-containing protein n=1 Tax=Haemophilus paraphrohaemolyticus TaxID=736 RepID=UPI001E299DAA|nr:nucleotidyltransferase domain-containing protein [Haemophilus paraphrohaemolyticus]
MRKYPEVEKDIIYGSCAKGNYRESSDIDLTLKGTNLIQTILTKIWLDLDESNDPYLFDLSIYSQLTNPDRSYR